MPELHYTHLLKEYICVCTEIARGAFDEDTGFQAGLCETGMVRAQ